MSRNLLIVESPSKAKTLKKYLGRDFEVLASYGHVRDLEAKEGAVDPDNDFSMRYALVERNKKHVDAIARAAEDADQILLATDPDREGEAIAWHLSEILRGKKSLQRPAGQAGRVLRDHRVGGQGRGGASARHLHAAGQRAAGAPRARPSGGLQSVSAAVAQDRTEPVRGPRAEPGPAPDRRARAGDRGVQEPGVLDRPPGQPQGQGEVHRPPEPVPRREGRAVLDRHRRASRPRSSKPSPRRAQGTATVVRVEKKPKTALAGGAVHHLHAAAGGGAQARHDGRARHAHRAAAVRRRGHRRAARSG